mgnify:FL=1
MSSFLHTAIFTHCGILPFCLLKINKTKAAGCKNSFAVQPVIKGALSEMIKGVNRQVVEVNETQCEYFEKIMFFVKPEYAAVSEGKIRERAGMIADSSTLPPPTKLKRNRYFDVIKLVFSALCGAAITIVMLKLFG